MVAGTLDEIDLSQLIQAYCRGRQSARINLTYPDLEGKVFIDAGDLVHAELGEKTGVAAVNAALAKKSGKFQVDLGPVPARRTITDHWTQVLATAVGQAPVQVRAPASAGVRSGLSLGGPLAVGGPSPPGSPTRHKSLSHSVRESKKPDSSHDTQPRLRLDPPPTRPSRLASADPGFANPRIPRVAAVAAAGAAIILLIAAAVWYPKHAGSVMAPAAAAVKQAPDASSAVITLGMSAALTGPAKELGRQMKLGIETCLKVVNDSGGINGHTFELVALDDGYEPDRTKETMRELLEQRKVFAIVGNVGTPTAEVAVPYALQKKVLFFGAFTGASLLRKEPPDRYVFNYRAGYIEETAAVVKYLIEVRKIKPRQIAVFAQEDGFGEAGFAGVTKALRKYGRDRDQVLRVGFKRNTLEVGDAVTTILKNRGQIQAIVMVAPYRPAAKFIEKLKEQNFEPIFTNVSFVGSTALAEELRQLGRQYAEGVIVTQVVPPVDSSATAVLQYREALQRYFREKPDFVSLEGYIATRLLMEGFRRAGKTPTTESLIEALEGIRGLDLGIGTPLSYGLSEHQASHKIWGTFLDKSANYQLFDLE